MHAATFGLSVTLFALLPGFACAASAGTLRLCHEDNESYPWILKSQQGLYATLAQLAERRLGMRIEVRPLPWKRCLSDVKAGVEDGVIGAGFLQERCEIGVYPGEHGCQPDFAQRLYVDRYGLYRSRTINIAWDGKHLSGYKTSIGVQPGFVAARALQQMGIPYDDTEKEPYQMLRKVSSGMLDAAVIQTPLADKLLREVVEFNSDVERMRVPFIEYPAYLVLSHQFVSANPKRAQSVWQAFAATRDSTQYQAAKASLGYTEPD